VQLFGDVFSSGPYDFRWNIALGADINAIYGGLVDAIGGIGAHTQYEALATEPALRWMKAHYASGIGPWKGNLPLRAARSPHPLLSHALQAGLVVHPYTLRAEEPDVSVIAEAVQLYQMGVQGFFIDQPDLGVAARDRFLGTDNA
jgi:glycerophosphoryl diester phosphodiesterase